MPFASWQQSKWAFATGQPFAKEWADKTNYKKLPVRKKHAKEEDVEEASSETTLASLTRNFVPSSRRIKVARPDDLQEMSQKRREQTATVQGDRFPMPDVKHARLALQMLGRAKNLSDDDRTKIRKRAEGIIARGHV